MTGARVTIGIPVRDNARTLRRAVASVLAQTRSDWRLVLSDDCSSDDSWALCESLAAADPRISARRQEVRRGFLNFGDLLGDVTTPWFAWLAADDHWGPDYLSSCLAVAEARPNAVSVLPRCAYIGEDEGQGPSTSALEGKVAERLRRYLAHPGGTRMYGLHRTDALRRAFPDRVMNAYDWFLMIGLLDQGPQLAVPELLLFRERTHWMRYADMADELSRRRLFRRFPVLDMSLAVWRRGWIPRGVLRDLIALNLRKHEEYLAVVRPRDYLRRRWLFRRLRLPLTTRKGAIAAVADGVARRYPDRRAAAAEVLARAMREGDAKAAMLLGALRAEGMADGDALACYDRAAELGLAEGAYKAALLRFAANGTATEGWTALLAAAHRGSRSARLHVARALAAGEVPAAVEEVARRLLRVPGAEPR